MNSDCIRCAERLLINSLESADSAKTNDMIPMFRCFQAKTPMFRSNVNVYAGHRRRESYYQLVIKVASDVM